MTRFDEMLERLAAIERQAPTLRPGWTLAQTLVHCAQGVEYSVTGYPRRGSILVRGLAGPLLVKRFLSQGRMRHDLTAGIPGAPPLGQPELGEAVQRLRRAIDAFRAFEGELKPHFAYGPVERADYEALHAMHFAEHLG